MDTNLEKKLDRKVSTNWNKLKKTFCNKLVISDIISPDLFNDYINQGWESITDSYKGKEKLFGKEKHIENSNYFDNLSNAQKKLTLEILGSIRRYMVDITFKYIGETKDNEFVSSGSSNVTSDYDISILGPDANNIMWKMFLMFLSKYGNSLPRAFDTNLYSSPLYIFKNNNYEEFFIRKEEKGFPRVNYNKRFFTLVPKTKMDIIEELTWATLKIQFIELNHPTLYLLQQKAKIYQNYLNKIFDEYKTNPEIEKIISKKNYSDETKNIIIKYYLQYKSQEIIQNYIYNKTELNPLRQFNGNSSLIFFCSNMANYFSSEAYYTSSAVNTIVVQNQLNVKLNFYNRNKNIINCTYIISAIENLGDMLNHIQHDKNEMKKLLIKYSKYLYRIYYSLGKLGLIEFQNKAINIKSKIFPYRKTYNIEKADKDKIFETIDYQEESKEKYIHKIKISFLKIIENHLQKNT